MNCLTDMGGKRGIGKKYLKDLNLGYTNLSGGVFFSVIWKNAVALRLEGTFGKISSDDKILKGITDIAKERFNRNLSFRSNISEVSLIAEVHPMYIFIDWPAKETTPPRFSPYITGGIGYFSFNPQTKLGNRFVDLQPLHTEGQGFAEYPQNKNYKLNQFMVPLGGGVKYELSPLLNVRAEFLYRKLFTDYLDDLSSFYIDPAYFPKYLSGAKLTNALLESKVTAIAYETIQLPNGTLPLLTPMSEVAGRMAVQIGAYYLEKSNGGKGILLSGVPGVRRGKVTIIGGGVAGTNAAKVAAGMGAEVTILDNSLERLRQLDDIFGSQIATLASNSLTIAESVKNSDLVIGAVLIPGAKSPKLVTEAMVLTMEPGSVIVDVAIDQGGIFETADHVTTHDDPVYVKDGVLH
jgi:hypothetical protein